MDVLAKSGEAAKAGPIGLVVILLLIIVCYFLFKSMSRHMRKVREGFPQDEGADGGVRDDGAQPDAAVAPPAKAEETPQTAQTTQTPPPPADL